MIIDNQSPPGAWGNELKAAPWGYGQQERNVRLALIEVRKAGLWHEAETLERHILALEVRLQGPGK